MKKIILLLACILLYAKPSSAQNITSYENLSKQPLYMVSGLEKIDTLATLTVIKIGYSNYIYLASYNFPNDVVYIPDSIPRPLLQSATKEFIVIRSHDKMSQTLIYNLKDSTWHNFEKQ